MPASIKHISTNVDRMADDPELLKLWNQEATDDRTPVEAWTAFIQKADEARIADRIPGSVGRTFKARYSTEPQSEPNKPAPKRTTRKPSAKAAGK